MALRPPAPGSEPDPMTSLSSRAAPVRWSISCPAPRPFHSSACKRRQGITDQFSIRPSSTAAAASLQSSAAFGSQRSSENHPPQSRCPAKSRQTANRSPLSAGSFFGGSRTPVLYPVDRSPGPASETLHDSGHSPRLRNPLASTLSRFSPQPGTPTARPDRSVKRFTLKCHVNCYSADRSSRPTNLRERGLP